MIDRTDELVGKRANKYRRVVQRKNNSAIAFYGTVITKHSENQPIAQIRNIMDVLNEYDFGLARISLEDVAAAVEGSPGNYLDGPITVERDCAVEEDIVVFLNAHDSVYRLMNGHKIPDTPDHFLSAMNLASPKDVMGYIKNEIAMVQAADKASPSDQLSLELGNMYKLRSCIANDMDTYFYPQDFFCRTLIDNRHHTTTTSTSSHSSRRIARMHSRFRSAFHLHIWTVPDCALTISRLID